VLVLSVLVVCTGCNYDAAMKTVTTPYVAGQYDVAAKKAAQLADKADDRSKLVFALEAGSALRAAGKLTQSQIYFGRANLYMEELQRRAATRLGQETGAVATNETARAYEGMSYDRVLLYTYQAVNALELGDSDNALKFVNAATDASADAVQRYQKRIEKAEQELAASATKTQNRVAPNQTLNSPDTQRRLDTAYGDLRTRDLSAYENYLNPFSEYLGGILFMAQGQSSSDFERAVQKFEKLSGLIKDNRYVMQDYALSEALASRSARMAPVTYVIFETGLAPMRSTFKIELPLFIFNTLQKQYVPDYIGIALPRLEMNNDYVPYIDARAQGESFRTALIADVDAIVNQEFRNELPLVITRTIVGVTIRTATAYGAGKAVEGQDNAWVTLITRLVAAGYLAANNRADTRTWQTLPKQFQIARFPTPSTRQVTINFPGGAGPSQIDVDVSSSLVNVIYVKSTSRLAPPSVRTFAVKLRSGSSQLPQPDSRDPSERSFPAAPGANDSTKPSGPQTLVIPNKQPASHSPPTQGPKLPLTRRPGQAEPDRYGSEKRTSIAHSRYVR